MLSRHFYMLSLFIFIHINLSICANNIQSHNGDSHIERRLLRKEDTKHNQKANLIKKYQSRLDYDKFINKEPVAQFDLASFIHQPDEYGIADSLLLEPDSIESLNTFNNNNDYRSLMEIDNTMGNDFTNNDNYDRDMPALNANSDAGLLKITTNNPHGRMEDTGKISKRDSFSKQEYQSLNMDSGLIYNPSNINSMNYLKFPFFSHNKNKTKKLTNKKRKIFGINCLKKEGTATGIKNKAKVNTTKYSATSKAYVNDKKPISLQTFRAKRDHWTDNRERQLQELEDIEKKVNSVEITSITNKLS